MASAKSVSVGQRVYSAFRQWYVNASGYRQLGLRADDLYMEEDSCVTEAIRRLPEEEQNLRMFRMKRAMDLSLKKTILPKEEWTNDTTDVRYLAPLIEEVRKEDKEREAWNRM